MAVAKPSDLSKDSLLIRCRDGNHYRVYREGQMQRLDLPDFKPSSSWLMRGLVHLSHSKRKDLTLAQVFEIAENGLFVEYEIDAKNRGETVLISKNKTAKFAISDLDHGTGRIWGTGVAAITYCKGE